MMYDQDLAARIDHTVLKATTNGNAIDQLCAEAKQYGFAAVCVPPYYVEKAVVNLKDSEVKVCSVVG
ncbi:MAG: 2-deoxyribose-5-phosphate aldolase, partial [Chitinophagales bacterium]